MIVAKNIELAIKKATPRQLLDALIQQNPDLMVEYVANNHRGKVIQMAIHDQRKPLGFDQLEFRFIDTKGRRYYGFPKHMPIPVCRFGKMRDFEMWMSVGVTPDEFRKIVDTCQKAQLHTIRTKKNPERVGLLLEELSMRCDMVVHTELLYQFLAVQWVRHDENPEIFDSAIQDEKVAQFKADTASGNTYFFFHQPELERLNRLYKFTPDEWQAYWTESEGKQLFLKKALEIISSKIELKNETGISTAD